MLFRSGGREPQERLTLTDALRAYTRGPASAAGGAQWLGALREGMPADWITLDRDPYEIPESELWQVGTVTAVVGGEVRWRA